VGREAMATTRECESALRDLAARLAKHADAGNGRQIPQRTVMCRVPDLATSFSGELRDGQLLDIHEGESDDAQIILTAASDDIIALVDGTLPIATAWASGRLRIDASVRDLLRVRTLL
jgi:hypothetical protein